MINNHFSSGIEKELYAIKTPPNEYTKKHKIFFDMKNNGNINEYQYNSNNVNFNTHNSNHKQILQKTLLPKHLDELDGNETNNTMNPVKDYMANENNNSLELLLSTPIINDEYGNLVGMKNDLLIKYSNKSTNYLQDDNTLRIHTKNMYLGVMNYLNIIRDSYNKTKSINNQMRETLLDCHEKYRHIMKRKDYLKEIQSNRQSSMLLNVNPLKTLSDTTINILILRHNEMVFYQQLFNSFYFSYDLQKYKETQSMKHQMNNLQKKDLLKIALTNLITKYGKITSLVPFNEKSKVIRILAVNDLKEELFHSRQSTPSMNAVQHNAGHITEQDEEDEEEDNQTERLIQKILLEKNTSCIPFQHFHDDHYKYGKKNIRVLYNEDSGELKILFKNEAYSLEKFLLNHEPHDNTKKSFDKLTKQFSTNRKRNNRSTQGVKISLSKS